MKRLFVDTNVFIRFLTGDPEGQAIQARDFLNEVLSEQKARIVISNAVIMELVFVLRSYYGLSKDGSAEKLMPIIDFCEVINPRGDFKWSELFEWERMLKIDFVDVLNYMLMRQESIETIISFDRDFDRFNDIIRMTPVAWKEEEQ